MKKGIAKGEIRIGDFVVWDKKSGYLRKANKDDEFFFSWLPDMPESKQAR